jgi:glycosyltransferase involved in cell wall biosynthesis
VKLRIAYLHYLQRTDTAYHHVRQFSEAVQALGHEVAVHGMNLDAVNGGATSGWARVRRGLKNPFRRYLHEPRELYRNLGYAWTETRMLRAERPDVLLVRDHTLTASCVPVSRRLNLPLVLEINAPATEARLYEDEYWHLPGAAVWSERWKVRAADEATVVSSALHEHLVRAHGVVPEKLTVVPNGADVELFHPDVPPDPAIGEWAGGATVIGFVGSFHKWHGVGLLAELMKRVLHARPNARFVVVGDGPERAVLRAAVGSDERARFLGRRPHREVPGLVAAFDIAVMPESNFYGSPLKVLEWMAAGRAVVAPDYGPLRDVIHDGIHALLFPPGDLEALVSTILRLVDDGDLRRALGAAACAHTRASFTWAANARRVIEVCERACRSRDRRAIAPARPAGAGSSPRDGR